MNYKILKIDITEMFIDVINNNEWTNHNLLRCEKFSSNSDDFVKINVNNSEYELQFKYHIAREDVEVIRKDFFSEPEFNHCFNSIDEFDISIWKDGENILKQNLQFEIVFDEYKIMDKLEI